MDLTLEPAGKADKKRIKALYLCSFPAEERAPFRMLWGRARRGRGQILAIRDGGAFVGFIHLLSGPEAAYLFYFAIDGPCRGKGYGSAAMGELRRQLDGRKLFLACESLDETAENHAQRARRHEFYLRCGFRDLSSRIKEANVVYSVMCTGGEVTPAEYDALVRPWAGRFLMRAVDLRLMP